MGWKLLLRHQAPWSWIWDASSTAKPPPLNCNKTLSFMNTPCSRRFHCFNCLSLFKLSRGLIWPRDILSVFFCVILRRCHHHHHHPRTQCPVASDELHFSHFALCSGCRGKSRPKAVNSRFRATPSWHRPRGRWKDSHRKWTAIYFDCNIGKAKWWNRWGTRNKGQLNSAPVFNRVR
jgi:hypothetical protein